MFSWEERIGAPISKLAAPIEEALARAAEQHDKELQLTPGDFLQWLMKNSHEMAGIYPNQELLVYATTLRTLQWRQRYRGLKQAKQNVFEVKFKSDLNSGESFILQNGLATLRKMTA